MLTPIPAFLIIILSFASAFILIPVIIPPLRKVGIVGIDIHKPTQPTLPEMGGLGIVAGFAIGVISAIALGNFFADLLTVDAEMLQAVLGTILIITIIGVLDDWFKLKQGVKALLPLLAALPLMGAKAGETIMTIPYLGKIDFGVFYTLVLLPLATTGAANAVNMLAGFNGLEVGMGLVAMSSLTVIAVILHATTALVLLLAGLGALLATLYYNWYPAKILIGDVGTLTIGAIVASAVIVGNFEVAGGIVIVPYFFDFLIKAFNRFPSEGWWGELREGRLYCPSSRPVGLCQLIMKISGGISERTLVLVLIGIEVIFGLLAIQLYVGF
jgi:UDP-N-acetylglucosamine--dolichyl-phosphate N-acetylglucosaminephosphotransferase